MINTRKEIRHCDIMVWVCFGLVLLVKGFTLINFAMIHEETKASIENIATAREANPLFGILISLDKIGIVLAMIILPAMLMTFYHHMRRKVMVGKVDLQTMIFFVQFAFFSLLLNIVNDGAILLGKLLS